MITRPEWEVRMFPNLVEYSALIAGAAAMIVIARCWREYYRPQQVGDSAPPMPAEHKKAA